MSLIGLFQLQGHTCEFVKFNIKYADITFNQTSSSFFILVTTISGLTPSVAAIIFCLFSSYLGQQKSVLCIIFALSTMNTYGVITVAFSLHKNTTSMILHFAMHFQKSRVSCRKLTLGRSIWKRFTYHYISQYK